MDFELILNKYVLPAGGVLLMAMISWGLKELQAWLKEKRAQAKTERKKTIFTMAMHAVEELAHQVKKDGKKMDPNDKEAAFTNKVKEFATSEKVEVTEEEINSMLKVVLGETRN